MRRADVKQICIWVACSRPVLVKAEIFRFSDLETGRHDNAERPSAIGFGSAKCLTLGDRVHIALVTAHRSGIDFPTDMLLAYDLQIVYGNGPKTECRNLAELGLLRGKNAIVYELDFPPTFFLRGKGNRLNLLHGSCRKLHGKGEDCLAAADELIFSSFRDLERRPSALFLTGDQIYADDVAGPLTPFITQLGLKLLRWEELLRGVNKRPSEIPFGGRRQLVKEFGRFTSGHAANHLLGFGEFIAMYMLAWNAENWPGRLPDPSSLPQGQRLKYRGQIRHLEETRRDLPAVRRVLANTPAYMICDDHEITDDWNITREWHDNVRASKFGKQIITNGLVAYWAFQGWGNAPAKFREDFIGKMAAYFGKRGDVTDDEMIAFEDFCLQFSRLDLQCSDRPFDNFC